MKRLSVNDVVCAGQFLGGEIEPGTFHGGEIEPGTFYVEADTNSSTADGNGGNCDKNDVSDPDSQESKQPESSSGQNQGKD